MTDFWLGFTVGTLGGFWLLFVLAWLLTQRVPTVDGAHSGDDDELDDWDDEGEADWIISEALLRTGSHE